MAACVVLNEFASTAACASSLNLTVTLAVAVFSPALAVIVAVPLATAVTLPFASTVATASLLDVQVTVLFVALAGETVAVNCSVNPFTTLFPPVIVILDTRISFLGGSTGFCGSAGLAGSAGLGASGSLAGSFNTVTLPGFIVPTRFDSSSAVTSLSVPVPLTDTSVDVASDATSAPSLIVIDAFSASFLISTAVTLPLTSIALSFDSTTSFSTLPFNVNVVFVAVGKKFAVVIVDFSSTVIEVPSPETDNVPIVAFFTLILILDASMAKLSNLPSRVTS